MAKRNYTYIKMQPVDTLRAVELAERCAPQEADTFGRDDLMELICGIAAIDNQIFRQEIAYQACCAIYRLNNEHGLEVARWMDKIYRERGY